MESPDIPGRFNRNGRAVGVAAVGVVESINELSRVSADLYTVPQDNEFKSDQRDMKAFCDSAWLFATILAGESDVLDPATILVRDFQVAQHRALTYNPPDPTQRIVSAISARASRHVARTSERWSGSHRL
jgi:hypothetical protein